MSDGCGRAQSARAQAYLRELVEVGKRYGLSLSHEDPHGAFTVEARDLVPSNATRTLGEFNDAWLLEASDDSEEKP